MDEIVILVNRKSTLRGGILYTQHGIRLKCMQRMQPWSVYNQKCKWSLVNLFAIFSNFFIYTQHAVSCDFLGF